jgi:NADH-quinone oxidoreductase subunit C
MDAQALQEFVIRLMPEADIQKGPQFVQVTVSADRARELLVALNQHPDTRFDFLFCLTGVDYPDYMQVVYHLRSTHFGHEMVVKGTIPSRTKPEIDTVCDIWRTAEFHEREVYDLFGIVFRNHPDLRRILLTDDWVGYPLRKDYSDPVNMIAY